MVFHRRNDPNVGFWRWSHRLVGTSFFGGPNRMTSNFEKTSPKINMSPLKGSISRWEHVSPKQQFSAGNCSKFPRSSFVSYQLQFRESLVITVLTQLELLKPTFYLLLLLHFYLFFGKAPYLLNYTHTWNKTQFLRLCGLSEKTSEYLTTFSIWDLFVCNPIVIGDIVGWLAPDFHLTTSHKLWLGRSHEFLLRVFLM